MLGPLLLRDNIDPICFLSFVLRNLNTQTTDKIKIFKISCFCAFQNLAEVMVFLKSILKTASVSITNNGGLKKLPDPNILMQLPGMFFNTIHN